MYWSPLKSGQLFEEIASGYDQGQTANEVVELERLQSVAMKIDLKGL